MKTLRVTTAAGRSLRFNLPPATWEGSKKVSTNVYRTAIWVSATMHRCIVETDNFWDDRIAHASAPIGLSYHMVEDPNHLNALAEEHPEVRAALAKVQLETAEAH